MGAFSRSWDLTKVTFAVMKKDKEIFAFPISAVVFSVVFLVLFVGLALTLGLFAGSSSSLNVLEWILIFVWYLGMSFINSFFATCVVYTSGTRFNGKDATFKESIGFAFKRTDKIFLWALLSATIGLILRFLENLAKNSKQGGKILISIIASILGAAWQIATIFVIQGIVYKNLGPFASIKESVVTLKKTWGESLIKYIGFGLIEFIFILGGAIIMIPLIIIGSISGSLILVFGLLAILLIYITSVVLVFNIADQVYNTALYIYATTNKVPEGFTKEHMKNVFQSKKNTLAIVE